MGSRNTWRKNPDLLYSYMPQLINNLKHPAHDAIVRNTIRTWQFMKIPEQYQGDIFEICYQHILSHKSAIAIKAFSMRVCANIAKDIPELKEELSVAINDQLEFGSPGIKSIGKKLIKKLSK